MIDWFEIGRDAPKLFKKIEIRCDSTFHDKKLGHSRTLTSADIPYKELEKLFTAIAYNEVDLFAITGSINIED